MSIMTTMYHYYWKEGNKIVIQNVIGPYFGQKHEHTSKDFEKWRKNIKPEHLINLDEAENP